MIAASQKPLDAVKSADSTCAPSHAATSAVASIQLLIQLSSQAVLHSYRGTHHACQQRSHLRQGPGGAAGRAGAQAPRWPDLRDCSRGSEPRQHQPCWPEACKATRTLLYLPLTPLQQAAGSYPVPPVNVSPMAHQQFYHVRLVSQDSNV
jgi:hypothetical protein